MELPLTRILVSCPLHGELRLTSQDVIVVEYLPKVRGDVVRDYYSFLCPDCDDEIFKWCSPEAMILLRRGNVRIRQIRLPMEVVERAMGVPITRDELLDLLLELCQQDTVTFE